jgi:hypothetical protein
MVSSSISLRGQRQGQSGVKCYEGAFVLAIEARLEWTGIHTLSHLFKVLLILRQQ